MADAIHYCLISNEIKFEVVKPNATEIRVIREFAYCLKVAIRENSRWTLNFGIADVEPGKTYTLAVSLASAAVREVRMGKASSTDASHPRVVI